MLYLCTYMQFIFLNSYPYAYCMNLQYIFIIHTYSHTNTQTPPLVHAYTIRTAWCVISPHRQLKGFLSLALLRQGKQVGFFLNPMTSFLKGLSITLLIIFWAGVVSSKSRMRVHVMALMGFYCLFNSLLSSYSRVILSSSHLSLSNNVSNQYHRHMHEPELIYITAKMRTVKDKSLDPTQPWQKGTLGHRKV